MRRDSAIPLYYQLETKLRRMIDSGELEPGRPLPSEDVLATNHGVSRITVRRALSILERDGLIVRRQGKGTFVAQEARQVDLPRFSGSMEDHVTMGVGTRVKVLRMEKAIPPALIQEKLDLDPGEKALIIDKIRQVKGAPLFYVINYLPLEVGENLTLEDLDERPVLLILEQNYGLRAVEALQTMDVVRADLETAELLNLRVDEPLIRVERTVYGRGRKPMEHVSVWCPAERYSFNIKLTRNDSDDTDGWDAKFQPRIIN